MKLIAIPLGFTGALDLKTTGEQPSELSAEVKPTFEMEHWYLSSRQVTAAVTGTLQAAGSSIGITIPRGERWWIQSVGANISLAAGELASNGVSLGILLSVGTQGVEIASEQWGTFPSTAGSQAVTVSRWFDRPVLANADNRLVFRNSSTLDQATAAQLRVLYTPFQV